MKVTQLEQLYSCLLYTSNDTYYLLKKTEAPVVIVECGFLSNWADCAKLQDENYQDKLVWAIHMGILKYMNSV